MKTRHYAYLVLTLFCLLFFSVCSSPAGNGTPFDGYIITGSSGSFTAAKDDVIIGTGTIQNVIEEIRDHAIGEDCDIQFGNGTTELDIGTDGITFDGSTGWGVIGLFGKITSAYDYTINLINGVYINSKADIKHTKLGSQTAIINDGGILDIIGGSVTTTGNGFGIYSGSGNSIITISGGHVSATYTAIHSDSNGSITIKGGTVSATNIGISSGGNVLIEIIGGSVSGGTAIYNNGNSPITISGGHVSGTIDWAVFSAGSGTLTISGGTISVPKNVYAVLYPSGITLGGNPDIMGEIWTMGDSVTKVVNVNPDFAPGTRQYTIDFYDYVDGKIAVNDGADFLENFALYDSNYKLEISGNNLVMKAKP